MPFRLSKRLDPVQGGCVVHLTDAEIAAMGLRPGDMADIEVWPPSTHLERIR